MRRKPTFKTDASQSKVNENDSPGCSGCSWMLIVSVGGYFIIMAIDRVWSGNGSRLDHLICYGVLISLVILIILAILQNNQDKRKLREVQQTWKHASQSADVAIVDRHYYPGAVWEDDYGVHSSRSSHQLKLELTSEQREHFPGLLMVDISVDGITYEKLTGRKAVRIYYLPDDPMTFLLEEEFK